MALSNALAGAGIVFPGSVAISMGAFSERERGFAVRTGARS